MTPQAINTVGLLFHPHKPVSKELADEIGLWFQSHGVTTWTASSWDEAAVTEKMAGTDLAVTLGGDGSMLRGARMVYPNEALLVGVNLGRVGFLTECSPSTWQDTLDRILRLDYWVENRMMIRAETVRGNQVLASHTALNDVVISRGTLARAIQLETWVDDGFLTRYFADGLIVSTATGSTAYSLAVGGPILPPELRNILIIPIAPHLTMDRAVVLADGAKVTTTVDSYHGAILTVDGQFEFELQTGDSVIVRACHKDIRFARVRPRGYFYRDLLDRLVPADSPGNTSP
ncbi:MAG: NAD(+)/NADH kinase [Chloroflexota bacterium]